MTVFENLKNKDIDELSEWLDKYGYFEDSPWMEWWNHTYCSKCESIKGKYSDYDIEMIFSYCELHDQCKFFPDMNQVPDTKEIIKMWLESEV